MHPILVGVLATLLSSAQLAAWLCIGAILTPRYVDKAIAVPFALLAGSASTAFVYAVGSYLGQVQGAIILVAVGGVGVLACHWRRLATTGSTLLATLRETIAGRPVVATVVLVVAGLLWIDAIVPPRDGDVMRYHLAHVRQILRDGRWEALSDYHYALPFGWTVNFLPFEHIGVPEAAHVLTLLTWCVMLLCAVRWLRSRGVSSIGLALLGVMALVPYVVKAVTTAHADLYCMLVVLAVGMLLGRDRELGGRDMMMLGFAAWIGAQSRYQLIAVGLVTVVMVAAMYARGSTTLAGVARHAGGALVSAVLASPFYFVNYRAFDNPIWPLMTRQINGLATYESRVANQYNETLTGTFAPTAILQALRALFTDVLVFPIPLVVLAFCIAAVWVGQVAARRLAAFAAIFAVIWFVVQPSLYPRFIMFFLPIAMLGGPLVLTSIVGRLSSPRFANVLRAFMTVAVVGFLALDLSYSKDAIRYVITGDRASFHRATWFYPVFDWVNAELPRDARFLVIVNSGHSYYLDRWYRKADPFLNGEVDWDSMQNAADLTQLLRERRYDYVILDDRDWSPFVGGSRMTRVLGEAIQQGSLVPVQSFELDLVTGRFRGTSERTWVLVLKVAS